MNPLSAPATVIEALAASLEAASAGNPDDAEPPAAVLWIDRDAQWRPVVPRLRAVLPQLLVLGEYDPAERTGPAIWLRCVIDRALEPPGFPPDATPIVYLPGAGRQELGAADACPDHLKPLVELQYRGACWTQRNGRDWTVEAFLTSRDGGGLGLDVARDAATRQSMQRALTALAATPVQALRGRRLDAADFDRLFSDDPVRDVLVWLNDPEAVRAGWEAGRWSAFASRCKAELGFDPEKDGGVVAAERLGKREGPWGSVWRRFAEAPALYPGVPKLLRKAMPGDRRDDLFAEPSSWPQHNERDEAALRRALLNLENEAPAAARAQVAALEKAHGARRGWVWAKLGQAPLAHALAHLAALTARASNELGGASVAEMAGLYAGGAWEIDAAALDSMAAVQSSADAQAVGAALNAIYRPWLESAARRLQALAEAEPFSGSTACVSTSRVAGGMPVLPGETAPASSSHGPSAPDLRSVAGGTPALPECLVQHSTQLPRWERLEESRGPDRALTAAAAMALPPRRPRRVTQETSNSLSTSARFDSAAPTKPTGKARIAAGRTPGASASISINRNNAVGALPMAITESCKCSRHSATAAAERVVRSRCWISRVRGSFRVHSTVFPAGSRARLMPEATISQSTSTRAPARRARPAASAGDPRQRRSATTSGIPQACTSRQARVARSAGSPLTSVAAVTRSDDSR